MPTTTLFKVGDTVHITRLESARFAGTYTVVKVNPTTYRLQNDATGSFLKAQHGLVNAGALDGAAKPTAKATAVPVPEFFHIGSVVKAKGLRGMSPDALFVITGRVDRGYRLFPLGGSDRYYTGIPAERLERVTKIDGWTA